MSARVGFVWLRPAVRSRAPARHAQWAASPPHQILPHPPDKDEQMKLLNAMLASSMAAILLTGASAVIAAESTKMDKMGSMDKSKMANEDEFMKSCDMDHDGMMSKDEMLKHMEKMFDKMDTKKTGKLDKTQTAEFLKKLTAASGS